MIYRLLYIKYSVYTIIYSKFIYSSNYLKLYKIKLVNYIVYYTLYYYIY